MLLFVPWDPQSDLYYYGWPSVILVMETEAIEARSAI